MRFSEDGAFIFRMTDPSPSEQPGAVRGDWVPTRSSTSVFRMTETGSPRPEAPERTSGERGGPGSEFKIGADKDIFKGDPDRLQHNPLLGDIW
jgi:hypothetical protein